MNNGEVFDLLSVVQAYDGRTVGESDVYVWADAAERGRWTFEQAREAVKAHHAESTEWIKPGHVTQRIRSDRSTPPRSNALPQATPKPASDEHRDRVMSWLADRLRWDREDRNPRESRECLAIECPHCGAAPHRPCWQTAGRRPLTTKPPIEFPHLQRRKAYRATEE